MQDEMTGSIAYFIMVHHKPAQFEWLMNAIYDPDDLFLVHVDLKSRLGLKRDRRGLMAEVRRICAGRPNVRIMRSRFTNWGGWSLSRVLLDAMGMAVSIGPGWKHFVNLSGQCYPLKPLSRIREELAEAGDRLHIEMRPFASLPPDDWHHDWRPMIETPVRALTLPGRRAPPKNFAIDHKGSQWIVVPRDFCRWVVDSPLTARVAGYLKHLLLSDELVMQTLAAYGPFRDRIADDYRRAIIWPGPKVLTIADLPFLDAGEAWFARKVDVERDPSLLAELARRNGFTPGPAPR